MELYDEVTTIVQSQIIISTQKFTIIIISKHLLFIKIMTLPGKM